MSISRPAFNNHTVLLLASSSPLCITYDPKERLITINCCSARLTDIANILKDENILKKESSSGSSGGGVAAARCMVIKCRSSNRERSYFLY